MSSEQDHKQKAMTIFLLGLLGIVLCQILAPIAMIMGNQYISECRYEGVEPDSLGVTGRILGVVGTILFVLSMIFVVLYLFFVFALIANGF